MLSFVLAPYTHLLSQTVHTSHSKKLVDRIIPPLLEHYPVHAHLGHKPTTHGSSSHRGHLCAQCQAAAAHQRSTSSKGSKAGKGDSKQAAPTELQADSSASSLQQPAAYDVGDDADFSLPGKASILPASHPSCEPNNTICQGCMAPILSVTYPDILMG